MIRLFLLYAILIFAKKAPQLIKDLMNIKGDNIGLKGLSIKNKMGEAALVGGAVKKGMNSIEGKTKGAIGGALGGLLRAKGGKTERLKAAAAGASKGFAKGKHDAAQNGDTKGIFGGAYKEMGDIASGGKTSFFNKPKDWLQQADDGIIKGFGKKGGHYANPLTAENQVKLNGLKADLTKRYGADKANEMLKNAIRETETEFKRPLDLSDEKQWMYLTKGSVWDPGSSKYVNSNRFVGISDAIDYSGSDPYTGIPSGSEGAIINDAYRYSNIATNIDKKKSAFNTAYQSYMSALSSGMIDKDDFENDYYKALESTFGKYREALAIANSEKIMNVNTSFGMINNKDMFAFIADSDGVKTALSKQEAALKANTDSAVQKEEIKQKADDGKK